MYLLDRCPGSANIRTPTLSIRRCPECGGEVEIFSSDAKVECMRCGFVIYNDTASCIQWCKHATECLGEERYQGLVEKRKV
jgi:ribosomal protein S27E